MNATNDDRDVAPPTRPRRPTADVVDHRRTHEAVELAVESDELLATDERRWAEFVRRPHSGEAAGDLLDHDNDEITVVPAPASSRAP